MQAKLPHDEAVACRRQLQTTKMVVSKGFTAKNKRAAQVRLRGFSFPEKAEVSDHR
jgi:hypothetical protein